MRVSKKKLQDPSLSLQEETFWRKNLQDKSWLLKEQRWRQFLINHIVADNPVCYVSATRCKKDPSLWSVNHWRFAKIATILINDEHMKDVLCKKGYKAGKVPVSKPWLFLHVLADITVLHVSWLKEDHFKVFFEVDGVQRNCGVSLEWIKCNVNMVGNELEAISANKETGSQDQVPITSGSLCNTQVSASQLDYSPRLPRTIYPSNPKLRDCFPSALINSLHFSGFAEVAQLLSLTLPWLPRSHYESNCIKMSNYVMSHLSCNHCFYRLRPKSKHHPIYNPNDSSRRVPLPVVGVVAGKYKSINHSVAFVSNYIVEPTLPVAIPITPANLSYVVAGDDFDRFRCAWELKYQPAPYTLASKRHRQNTRLFNPKRRNVMRKEATEVNTKVHA